MCGTGFSMMRLPSSRYLSRMHRRLIETRALGYFQPVCTGEFPACVHTHRPTPFWVAYVYWCGLRVLLCSQPAPCGDWDLCNGRSTKADSLVIQRGTPGQIQTAAALAARGITIVLVLSALDILGLRVPWEVLRWHPGPAKRLLSSICQVPRCYLLSFRFKSIE